jgi:hypothetical protein
MSVRIVCINKDNGYHQNPHEAIQFLGWLNESTNETGKSSRIDIYNWLLAGNQAYVKDGLGSAVFLQTAISPSGTKFVRTVADRRETNNLLSLPECR